MPFERVQILLEPGQRAALAQRARQTGRSVSDLVREKETSHEHNSLAGCFLYMEGLLPGYFFRAR